MAEARRHGAKESFDERGLVGPIGGTYIDGTAEEFASDVQAVVGCARA